MWDRLFNDFGHKFAPQMLQNLLKKRCEIKMGIWMQILVEKGGPGGYDGHWVNASGLLFGPDPAQNKVLRTKGLQGLEAKMPVL